MGGDGNKDNPFGASAGWHLVAIWFVGGAVLVGVRKDMGQFFFVTGRFVTILLQSLWK